MTDYTSAEKIMGQNFLGPKQINKLLLKMGKSPILYSTIPDIQYDEQTLEKCKFDHILVLGTDNVDIMDFRDFYGIDPEVSEPCLYNQDWYLSENFVHKHLDNTWYLIGKNILEGTRSIQPVSLIESGFIFPSAILCVYTFFAYYETYQFMLWYHDFVWCSDTDHNGDRIYVAKYHDIDGINKNGFSIHRHLSLRPCYGVVSVYK